MEGGTYSPRSLDAILSAFRSDQGSARTFAACLMVSDGIRELQKEARCHLRRALQTDDKVDGLTALLILETFQLFPDADLRVPCIVDFLRHAEGHPSAAELAGALLKRTC